MSESDDVTFEVLRLSRPHPPSAGEIRRFAETYSCGVMRAKETLQRDYEKDLQGWLIDSVDRLLAQGEK